MDPTALIASLDRFPGQLRALLLHVPDEVFRFQPSPGAWSIAEIVGHLVDEEKEDFRVRLAATFAGPDVPWPPIDPPARVIERRHQEADVTKLLDEFAALRFRSITWLDDLEDPNWDAAHVHPVAGTITAGDLLLSWAAHDILHLRQIGTRLWQHAVASAPGRRADYAGPAPV